MRFNKLSGCCLSALLLLGLTGRICAESAGTTGAIILKHNYNPRAAAMGEAYVAMADDVYAMYWNPAGMSFLEAGEISTSFYKGLVDDYFGQVSYVQPIHDMIVLGAGLLTYSAGNFDLVDGLGNTSRLKAQRDYLAVLSGALKLNPSLRIGLTLEGLHSTLLQDYTGMTGAVTMGITHQPEALPDLRLGLAVKHLGFPLSYGGAADPLPLSCAFGLAYKVLKTPPEQTSHELTLSLDTELGRDTPVYVNLGAEYWYAGLVAIRAGYQPKRDLEIMSLGAGVQLAVVGDLIVKLDYALCLTQAMNHTHKAALSCVLPR
ncbi:PorV/PorQ family protein [candidate division FCPU426 bacterium]|nr:PorV/PorQ family protein [candidate division FCPU426 bacterium]